MRRCKDCEAGAPVRPAPHPGPRCATHHRAARKARQAAKHGQAVQRTYGLPAGGYDAILAAQSGVCAGCGPRTGRNGRTKRLAVDHDHATGEVRGLLCSTCNRTVGEFRDDPMTFLRLALYLLNPPARSVVYGGHHG
jgi:Recombination endonuclease VII